TYVLDPRVARRGFDKDTRIYLQDVQAVLDKHRTAQLVAGQSFGETSALSRTPREFTVFADSDAELVEVRWQGLRRLVRRGPARPRRTALSRAAPPRVPGNPAAVQGRDARRPGPGRQGSTLRVVRLLRQDRQLPPDRLRGFRTPPGPRAGHRGRGRLRQR